MKKIAREPAAASPVAARAVTRFGLPHSRRHTTTPIERRAEMKRTKYGTAGFIAGVLAFVVLVGGGGAAWAQWTATAQGTGSVTTPSVAITQVNFPALNATYTNAHARQTATGPFTITNTGTVAGVATTQIATSDTIAAQMPLLVWPVQASGECTSTATAPTSATAGTWASTTISGTALAANQSQIFCVRTTIPRAQRNGVASTTGAATARATLNVSLATNTGWTGASIAATATQSMDSIYPLDATLAPATTSRWHSLRSANGFSCLDAEANNAVGNAIAYQCGSTTQANQLWQVVPVSDSDRTLVTLRPRHAPESRLAVDGNNRQVLAAGAPGALAQQWYVQRISPTTVQFVSATNGLCLVIPPTSGVAALTMVDCGVPDASTVIVNPLRLPLGFATNATTTTLTVGPRTTAQPMYLQRLTGGSWTTVTVTSQATALAFANTALTEGANTMRIIFSDGTVPAYDTFVLNRTGTAVTAASGMG